MCVLSLSLAPHGPHGRPRNWFYIQQIPDLRSATRGVINHVPLTRVQKTCKASKTARETTARGDFYASPGGTEHPYVDDDDWDSTDPHIAMMIADHIGDLKARRADELGEHPFALCLRAVNSSIPTTPPPHHDTEYTKSGSITLTDRVWIDQGGDWDDSMPSWTAEFGPWRRDYLTDSDSDS